MPENNQSTSEARLLSDERFLRRIAYQYYEDGHSQEAIAETEFCSRQTVSKALQKAKDKGIVRISIVPDMRTGYLRNLQREVRLQLGLEDLVLVPGGNLNAVPAEEFVEDTVAEIVSAAAEYLDQMLVDSDVLAISGGRTFMRGILRYLKPSRSLSHLQIVATIGFVESHTSYGDANLIAHDLAEAYGANHMWFPCPAFLPTQAHVEHIRQFPVIREAYEMMTRANIVVLGLWTPHANKQLISRGILSQEQLDAIGAFRPVADMNHWVFDGDGNCINSMLDPFPYALTGLEVPILRERMKNSNVRVILVAGGSSSYIPAIRAVLKGGLANILITDHTTAQFLLVNGS
jgi:deoxyribonucleoside regulator